MQFPQDITPILVSISIPNLNTNVLYITVVIKDSTGKILFTGMSREGTNKVDNFQQTPYPPGITVTITFKTRDGKPAEHVTISIIACYTPSTATMVATSGPTRSAASTMKPQSYMPSSNKPLTTTSICTLTEGMGNPQYIHTPTFTDLSPSCSSDQVFPGSDGVNFTTTYGSVIMQFPQDITPILVSISIPNLNT
ncbi:unnamed protein product, partial [Adineta steineri]